MFVARGLPCPVGLLRSGRRNTLVIKATFRLDGIGVWAPTQAPLREAVTDDFGRRVFPSDFQAHKSACDVVIAGATLNALGPVRVRVGRHQMFADEPRALGPVMLADAKREASFARPTQQLPLPEFPVQVEVVLAGARTLLRLTTPPVHVALVLRDDWAGARDVPLNLDAILIDPMREVAEFLFRGFFGHTGDIDRDVLAIVGPNPLTQQPLGEATHWPRTEATEPRARSVRETAFDLDEETFVGDDADDEQPVFPPMLEPDEESTGLHRSIHTQQMDVFDPESTRPRHVALRAPAMPALTSERFASEPPAKTPAFSDESTQVDFAIPAARPIETPFEPESTRLHVVLPTPGKELPFAPESTRLHVLPQEPAAELPFKRTPARTLIGGEANRALPFRGADAANRAQTARAAPPDGSLPFRNETLAIPISAIPGLGGSAVAAPASGGDIPFGPAASSALPSVLASTSIAPQQPVPPSTPPPAPPVAPPPIVLPSASAPPFPSASPMGTALGGAPLMGAPLGASAASPLGLGGTLSPNVGPSAIVFENLPTPAAPEPAPVVIAEPAKPKPPTRAPGFAVDGLTVEQYADIRSRLWKGEPRADVLREHKLNEIRFRVLEKKLQRYLDELPPNELGKIIDLLG